MFDLSKKKAIVTGASRGIGKTVAIGLADHGVEVACLGRDQKALAEALAEIEAGGGRGITISADLSRETELRRGFDEAHAALGGLDILVNNAGVDDVVPALDQTVEAWDAVLAMNLRAPFLLSQLAGRIFVEQRTGKIINISSVSGLVALPNDPAYTASKAGLLGLTRALALEWAKSNVQVNALAPGFLKTDMTAEALADERASQWVVKRTPMRRWGETSELLGAVIFLASSESDFMTGQSLVIDGGWTIQ